MRLFKYISLDELYWSEILRTNNLYFPPIDQLRKRNDTDEFNHTWDTKSYFFQRYGSRFIQAYENTFSNAGIFCVSKCLSKRCKDALLPNSKRVICYEFEFDPKDKRGISSDHVLYSANKISNVPDYVIANIQSYLLRSLLEKKDVLTKVETSQVTAGIRDELSTIFNNHIWKELTLKKLQQFDLEQEYRFIHLKENVGPVRPQKLIGKDNRISADDVGLRLICIYTNDLATVLPHSEDKKIRTEYFDF